MSRLLPREMVAGLGVGVVAAVVAVAAAEAGSEAGRAEEAEWTSTEISVLLGLRRCV